MAKIKLTKNELKVQRDALKRFERYLPTLQLKKQQLQLEVRQLREQMAALERQMEESLKACESSIRLLSGPDASLPGLEVSVRSFKVTRRNVAGIDVPLFAGLEFAQSTYDIYTTPPWYDDAVNLVRTRVELTLKRRLMDETQALLEQELRVVTQRVNLFEKVKIPEARENIRRINIYIGDQMTNSVGRSKIAKGKCAQRDAETVV